MKVMKDDLSKFTSRMKKTLRTKRLRIKRINQKAAAALPALMIHRVQTQTEPEPSQAEPTDCQKCCELSHEPGV